MNTPDLPKSCKQPSLWQVPLILLLIIIPLLILSEKPFAIEHILLAIACVFISLRMLTAYRFDADGVTNLLLWMYSTARRLGRCYEN